MLNLTYSNRKGFLGAVKVKGSDHKAEIRFLRRGSIKGQNIQGQLEWCCKQPDLVGDIPVCCRGFGLGVLWGSLPTPIILIFDSMEGRWRQSTFGGAQ